MTTRTLRAVRERCTAACPAELPPPTTITSSSRHRSASDAMTALYTPAPVKRSTLAAESVRQRAPVATTTVRASACWPSSRSMRTRPSAPRASSTARWKLERTASKRRACSVALRVSSLPEIPAGEADVVLDPRAGAGLPARRPRLSHERAQALGPAVHGGREPGRPAAEHDQVEPLAVDLRAQAELAGDLGGRGVAQHGSVAHQKRRLLARDLKPVEHRRALGVGVDVVPAHRDEIHSRRSRTSNARREPRDAISRS